ncbi:MAG: MT-A70 family methyltransferase [Alphaproteobacteria bacterium]
MPPSPPHRKYAVIYADPPWWFATYSAKGRGRCADAHFDCLGLDELLALPVETWAAKDSALFLWTTDPMLSQALEVIRAWGFKYKTVAFYWAKLNKAAPGLCFTERDFFTGLGYWTRANAEQCLLATRGAPKRRAKDVRRLLVAPRREHSRKPDAVYERIERLVEGPYLELFARNTRPGWDNWGDEVGLFDRGPVHTRRWPSAGPSPEGVAAQASLAFS